MKKIVKLSLWGSVMSMLFLGFAKAQDWSGGAGGFAGKFKTVYNWVVTIAGVIFIVMFLIGGIQYLTSAGNEEAAGKAKKLLIDAVIGIIVVAIAYLAGSWILQAMNISNPIT